MEVEVRRSPKHLLPHALKHAGDPLNDFHAIERIIWSRGTVLDHVQTHKDNERVAHEGIVCVVMQCGILTHKE